LAASYSYARADAPQSLFPEGGFEMKRLLMVLAFVAPLGACAQLGESAAGAGASVASSSLTSPQKQEGVAKLNKIAHELFDAHKLYDEAGKLAKDREFKAALHDLATERQKEARDVQGHVRELGGKPVTQAGAGSGWQGAWMNLKSVVESDTKAAVQQVLSHEDGIIRLLTDDLADDRLADSTKEYIKAIRDNVQGDRDRIASLKR
jgi:uncharacterized protein (TIGR02284 family)